MLPGRWMRFHQIFGAPPDSSPPGTHALPPHRAAPSPRSCRAAPSPVPLRCSYSRRCPSRHASGCSRRSCSPKCSRTSGWASSLSASSVSTPAARSPTSRSAVTASFQAPSVSSSSVSVSPAIDRRRPQHRDLVLRRGPVEEPEHAQDGELRLVLKPALVGRHHPMRRLPASGGMRSRFRMSPLCAFRR